ncbi:MAG: flotillin family protein [Chloroflexi bacterium]|nr:flotillin family protein [Chloroflexota bacterium]
MAPIIKVAGPNEAVIRSGGGSQPKVTVGGRLIVLPIFFKAQRISLEVMTLPVETAKVYTKEGVAVTVDGVAQVKVARAEEAIRTAAQQFIGKREAEIAQVALQTLEGAQRAILGTMTVEAIYQDRESFAESVSEVAGPHMANMGLEIVSFTIRDIRDEQGYLDALGRKRTAEVTRDAEIGEAEAERDAAIRRAEAQRDAAIVEANANRDQEQARFEAETNIAEAERDFAVQKARYEQETNARRAEAELAYALQEAVTQQDIREQELQVEVVERTKQIEVEQQEIARRERELEAGVKRPAEAERYRLETIAAGEKTRVVAEAEAAAEAITLNGNGEADAIRARGEAEADAIRAQGLAEADAMRTKAEAWKQYGQAAMIDTLLESLPDVAAAVSQPLGQTDRIVMISGDGSIGASKLTGDVTQVVSQLPDLVESLTGIDILGTLKNLPRVATTEGVMDGNGAQPETTEAAEPTADEDATPS